MRISFILSFGILFLSCTKDNSFPRTYKFDKSEITESLIYTIDEMGNDVYPSTIAAFSQSGVTQEEFFVQILPPFGIDKIILQSENSGTIEFNQSILPLGPQDFTYSENQSSLIPEFGVIRDVSDVYAQACLSLNAETLPYIPGFTADFCDDNSALEACKRLFEERSFDFGDTLALSLHRYIFKEE